MEGTDCAALYIGYEHRHAVRDLDAQQHISLICDNAITAQRIFGDTIFAFQDANDPGMNLS